MIEVDRRLLMRTTLLWLACYAAAAFFDPLAWVLSGPGLVESLFWLVILSLPACSRSVGGYLAALPRKHRRTVAVIVAALLFGQLAGSEPERTFPLAAWRMFSRARALGTLTFFDYVGNTDDGGQIPLNPTRFFPSINHTVMMALEEKAAGAPQRLSGALQAIGRMHNRLSPTAPVRSVSLVRCTVDARAPAAQRQVRREPVLTADLPGRR